MRLMESSNGGVVEGPNIASRPASVETGGGGAGEDALRTLRSPREERGRCVSDAAEPSPRRRRRKPPRRASTTLSQFWERVRRGTVSRAGPSPGGLRAATLSRKARKRERGLWVRASGGLPRDRRLRWARHASPLRKSGRVTRGLSLPLKRLHEGCAPGGPRPRRAEFESAGKIETRPRTHGTAGGSAALGTVVSCHTQRAARPPL